MRYGGEELLQLNWTLTFWSAYLQCIAIFCFYWICSAVRGPRIDIHSASLQCPCICTSESQLMGILTPFKTAISGVNPSPECIHTP